MAREAGCLHHAQETMVVGGDGNGADGAGDGGGKGGRGGGNGVGGDGGSLDDGTVDGAVLGIADGM